MCMKLSLKVYRRYLKLEVLKVCINEKSRPFPRGDNYEKAEIE